MVLAGALGIQREESRWDLTLERQFANAGT
jgi:hypothetical protein